MNRKSQNMFSRLFSRTLVMFVFGVVMVPAVVTIAPIGSVVSFAQATSSVSELSFVTRTCDVTANAPQVQAGTNVVISWTTQGFDKVTINGRAMDSLNGSYTYENIQENTTYTLVASTADGKNSCVVSVTVVCISPPPPTCTLTPTTATINSGETVTLTWTTTNGSSANLTDFGSVPLSGNRTTGALTAGKTYTLSVLGQNGSTVSCQSVITVKDTPPPPTCSAFTATPISIVRGVSSTLSWSTTNATRAVIDNGIGEVSLNGTFKVTPLATTIYTLTAYGANASEAKCQTTVVVTEPPVQVCDMQLTKTVSSATAAPGDTLTYTITIKNIGTANCTGSGVKIIDVHDANLTFVSASQSSNILPGYVDVPLYTPNTRTITWNGEVLTPGEEGTMSFVATVKSQACGTTKTIVNSAKATAQELNNYQTWRTSNQVSTLVTAPACPIPPPTCTLTPTTATINSGGTVNLVWTTTNASTTNLTDFGSVPLSGNRTTGALTASKTYTLSVLGQNGSSVSCQSVITVKDTPPPPTCSAFTATPSSITRGTGSTLSWSTTNATRAVIDNGIGEVSLNGTFKVTPLATAIYTLTAYGANASEAKCQTTVVVTEPPVVLKPKCTAFTANPSSLPFGGGAVALAWATEQGVNASIAPLIGAVALSGSTTVTVATTTTFILTVNGTGSNTDSCSVTVPVQPPAPLSCAANVSLSLSDTRISRGNDAVLSWNTTGVNTVRFDQGITATSLGGSITIAPRDTTTYTLTAIRGSESVSCPITLSVTSGGGGGGGSRSPTCELTVTKNKIKLGEAVTLRWDSKRADDLVLKDSLGKTLVTTKDKRSSAKDDWLSGSLQVAPTTGTTYTLTVERGSRDRVCKVVVDVENVIVTEVRDQQPLVTGIALTQVPYTGFAAGPMLTLSFYALLMAWALYIAYVLVIKRDVLGGVALSSANPSKGGLVKIPHINAEETIRPDVFVANVRAPESSSLVNTPINLPTAPVVGYTNSSESLMTAVTPEVVTPDEMVTAIENHAHAKKSLLSSDAIRQLLGVVNNLEEAINVLNDVIVEAKAKYPAEDGWVVINEKRMRELCLVCQAKPVPSSVAPYVPTVIPEGSGSLAEAVVTGNVIAAYELIGHRPMFALADAAADLDALYRGRKTGQMVGSELLRAESAKYSDAQILEMINALTGALDGVYTDESSAVKMAIMKAIKAGS